MRRVFECFALALSACIAATNAAAQQVSDAPAADGCSEAGPNGTDECVFIWEPAPLARLDPVIVNGQPTSIYDTAASLAFIETDAIEDLNAIRIGEVLANAPGVFVSGLNGPREIVQIRSTLAFDNRVLFLEDGVPLQSSIFFDQSALGYSTALASPGGVEVLRGPGTALHGSDAFTGVINVRSKDPGSVFAGGVRARYGEFGLFDGQAEVTGPIGDNQSFRLTGAVNGEDGFRDETAFSRFHLLGRHTLDLDRFSADTVITYTESETESATAIPLEDFEAGEIFGSGLSPLVDPEEAIEEVEYFRAQTKLGFDVTDSVRLETTPYYRSQEVEATLTFQPATAPRETADVDTFGLLNRAFLDHGDGATTTFGVDLEVTDFSLFLFQDAPDVVVFGDLFVQGVQFDYTVDFLAVSPFVQHERSFGPVTLSLGLRFDRLRYDFDNNLEEAPGDALFQVEDRVDTFNAFSPKARLLWDVADNHQIFARYARGFRIPRASDLYELDAGQAEFELDPERLDSGEIGWRANWSLFGRNLNTELIGFWQVSRDGVVTSVDTAAGDISINAGSQRFAGIEFAANAELGFGFDAQAAFAYQDLRFRQFAAEPGSPFDGNRIEEAPITQGTLTINWVPPVYEALRLTSRLRHQGRWPLNSANTLFTDNEFILSLLGEWRATDWLVLEIRAENVTDALFPVFADAPFFAPAGRARPGQPRTLSGGFRLSF